jgi:hypothetical protein
MVGIVAAAKSQCDKMAMYFEPHTLLSPTPLDVQKDVLIDINQRKVH